jgi:hypothetical protein
MLSRPRLIAGSIIIVLTGLFLFFYQFFGLKYYIDAVIQINGLSQESKDKAINDFYGSPSDPSFHGGILASTIVNNNKIRGLWIWGTGGLKYFRTGTNSVFSSFSICAGGNWRDDNQQINKNDNINLEEWGAKAKQGTFVTIYLEADIIREAVAYDWWFFAPATMEYLDKTCAK